MRKLTVKLQRGPDDVVTVGTLAEQDRRVYFEYDASFVNTGLELSPFKLPVRTGLIEHADLAFGALPGVFDDSLPDGWGLLLMDRHFRRKSVDPMALSPLDRLAYLGTRTMGALTYHPATHDASSADSQLIDLYDLGRNAEDVFDGDAAEVIPALMRAGGSPGGARPKILVGINGNRIISGEGDLPSGFEYWIVKFAGKADAMEAGPIEFAYSLMARSAGIDLPPTRLFEVKHGRSIRRYFGVKRFDRAQANHRTHVHTFGNLIHVNFRVPSTDYADLFKVTRALTQNHGDVLRLFRQMVFNITAHNRDDHAKNFAFLLDDETGSWSLSPAYDLTFTPGPGGEHTTTILGEGRAPSSDHCLKLAEQFDIKKREASAIIDEVNHAITHWHRFAKQAGCTMKDAKAVERIVRTL